MRILGIDPGDKESAWCLYENGPIAFGTEENYYFKDAILGLYPFDVVAVEMIACYGMPVGKEVFETCVWIGRFLEKLSTMQLKLIDTIYRKEVALHLCHSPRAKDSNVRQALIDRFGDGSKTGKGTKKNPGALYGMKDDEWAALAVCVTYAETKTL